MVTQPFSTEEQLIKLMSTIYMKADCGATYEDVMKVLTEGLTEVTKHEKPLLIE